MGSITIQGANIWYCAKFSMQLCAYFFWVATARCSTSLRGVEPITGVGSARYSYGSTMLYEIYLW